MLNNRLFTNEHKRRYILECLNVLNGKTTWNNCVELSIIVAVRRSERLPVKNSMAFCTALLKNPGGLVSDMSDGILSGYYLP